MSIEFPRDLDIALPGFEPIYGADVVETPGGDEAATGRVRTRHHPRGAQGDRVDLVGAVRVPHDQLAVLRRTH